LICASFGETFVSLAIVEELLYICFSEPCYVDNNLFTIRHIPSYNISPHIGSWDRNNTLG